jgi:hypothetical protein
MGKLASEAVTRPKAAGSPKRLLADVIHYHSGSSWKAFSDFGATARFAEQIRGAIGRLYTRNIGGVVYVGLRFPTFCFGFSRAVVGHCMSADRGVDACWELFGYSIRAGVGCSPDAVRTGE